MTFNCPVCNQSLEADDDIAGKDVQCPNCGRYIGVPDPGADKDAAPPSDSPKPPPAPASVPLSVSKPKQIVPVTTPAVVITDIRVPFWSIFVLVLKVFAAGIMASLMLGGLYMLIILGGCAALLGGAAMSVPK